MVRSASVWFARERRKKSPRFLRSHSLLQSKHTYRLEYFPIHKGRAERVRLTLALAGVEWDDVSSHDFAKYKAQGDQLPWGHFPLLRVDGGKENGGHNLSNSVALQWYICAEEAPELIPKDPLDQHWALSTSLTTEDRFVAFIKFAFAGSDTKGLSVIVLPKCLSPPHACFRAESMRQDGIQQTERHVADLSARLGHKEYMCSTLSFADITVFDWIDQTDAAFESRVKVQKYANLASWLERIENNPRLKAYWKKRENMGE